ncbi:hydroxyacylglutathione hydrolase [Rubellimicrobium sp. CFH 75288]|uniref:hydroxyacylglutathione hydrolase n=1 Tax=Rubellimicrobium sp. CFH 75288 TaxID=2697034 RepID=UPI0014121E6C|nr:hydroxyacylglutathione hydrolase [Rubellimicrobium sp. CFH 75288]NAZ36520.1 hydroxyacylglutathione hydrolase [Rubellimicrobium sp. CFH 75288]
MPTETARLRLVTVPCLRDNYAFLLHDDATGRTALVDAPEAEPIRAELERRGWQLSDILITHHHDDHVQAVDVLRPGARVIGHRADRHRLPPLDLAVSPGEALTVCGEAVEVIDTPGHTIGHLCYHFPRSGVAFTADTLMALGCGRLFEGTAAQMWASLRRLAALPPDTILCSGHEYTEGNARFALSVDGDNPALQARARAVAEARARGEPTVPSRLADELATNPFLRADDPAIRSALGLAGAPAEEVFAALRAAKDRF